MSSGDLSLRDAPKANQARYRKGGNYTADDLRTILSSAEGVDILLTIEESHVPSVVNLLHVEIQTTGFKQESREYRRLCTKSLRNLVDRHRVLPASLFVNDIKDTTLSSSFGGYSDIYRGTSGTQPICLKVLRVCIQNEQQREEKQNQAFRAFYKEALLWTQLSHPNVLPFLGVNTTDFSGRFCLVSPWMVNGEIKNFLKENPGHDKLVAITEIAAGMSYLHSVDIVHADIKGANVLVDIQGHCRLADFGLAVSAVTNTLITSANDRKGTIRWMAPELLIGRDGDETPYDKRAKFGRDIYAYAMTVLEIITGSHPFPEIKQDATVILQVGMLNVRPDQPTAVDWCPKAIWILLQYCWTREPHLRPTSSNVHSLLLSLQTSRHLKISWENQVLVPVPVSESRSDLESTANTPHDKPRSPVMSASLKNSEPGLQLDSQSANVDESSSNAPDLMWTLQSPLFVARDDSGRICFSSADNYSIEDAQKLADIVHKEIQTKAASDTDYCKDCTQYLEQLFKIHRILPASLLVDVVVRPEDKLQPVGGGGFSDIYTAVHGSQAVCLKVLRVFSIDDISRRDETIYNLYKETLLWTQLNHPNVLPFLGWSKGLSSVYPICMVSPWMENGDVVKFLKKNPDHDRLVAIREIASGMSYLHSRHVVHGDIRPLKQVNILVNENGRCHLADFGLATIVFESANLGTARGTFRYMAPEVIFADNPGTDDPTPVEIDKFAADVYGYACTVLEIITGKYPFPTLHDGLVIVHLVNPLSRPGKQPTEANAWCPDSVWTLIEKCWDRTPHLRPSADDIQSFLERIEELRHKGEVWDRVNYESDWRRHKTDLTR
ncbi:kinase-like protein [Marasmius fiardii PR-910]|nr:kinase-like protein [Marasmius fiardii PR-910]